MAGGASAVLLMCCILFCTLLSIGYGVGFFVVGGLFYDDPCEKDLAIWCIVQGSLYFGRMAIPSLILRIGLPGIARASGIVFSLANLAWVIVGTVWLSEMSYYRHYCQNDLYLFTLATVIIQWVATVLSFFVNVNLKLKLTTGEGADTD